MNESRSSAHLSGKQLPGDGRVVDKVEVLDEKQRRVHFQDGTSQDFGKRALKNRLYKSINKEEREKALKSIRTRPDGTVSAKLGGQKEGSRKVFKTKAGAKRSITRKYGKTEE